MSAEEAIDAGRVVAPDETLSDLTSNSPLTGMPWLWLAALFALNLGLPFVPVPNRILAQLGTAGLTILYVVIIVEFVAQTTRLQWSLKQVVPLFALSLLGWIALQWFIAPTVSQSIVTALRASGLSPTPGQLLPLILVNALTDMALLCAAVWGGSLISRIITTPNMLGPVCAIIALIDVWGVLFGGIVSQLMAKAPELTSKAMVKGPMVGVAAAGHHAHHIAVPSIGVGDYLFLGLLFAVLHAQRMNWQDAIKWTVPLMAVALLAVSFPVLGIDALPGLLFIGLGVAIPNLKYFHYTREEKFALLYAGVFVILLTGALYAGFTRMLPAEKAKVVKTIKV